MNGARSIRWALLGLATALVPREADAYIDPGTGSYLVQALVAAVAGGAMAMKVYWHRVKAFFGGSAALDENPTASLDETAVSRETPKAGPADE